MPVSAPAEQRKQIQCAESDSNRGAVGMRADTRNQRGIAEGQRGVYVAPGKRGPPVPSCAVTQLCCKPSARGWGKKYWSLSVKAAIKVSSADADCKWWLLFRLPKSILLPLQGNKQFPSPLVLRLLTRQPHHRRGSCSCSSSDVRPYLHS